MHGTRTRKFFGVRYTVMIDLVGLETLGVGGLGGGVCKRSGIGERHTRTSSELLDPHTYNPMIRDSAALNILLNESKTPNVTLASCSCL